MFPFSGGLYAYGLSIFVKDCDDIFIMGNLEWFICIAVGIFLKTYARLIENRYSWESKYSLTVIL